LTHFCAIYLRPKKGGKKKKGEEKKVRSQVGGPKIQRRSNQKGKRIQRWPSTLPEVIAPNIKGGESV